MSTSDSPAEFIAQGKIAFNQGDLVGAHALFSRAHARAMNDPVAMSWHGLTLVLVERNSSLGVLYCEEAVRMSGNQPELLLNEARVYLALGQRERAVRAVLRGLERAPDDAALMSAREALGRRRLPILPFFSRKSFVNRWLGKVRYRMAQSASSKAQIRDGTIGAAGHATVGEVGPAKLGLVSASPEAG